MPEAIAELSGTKTEKGEEGGADDQYAGKEHGVVGGAVAAEVEEEGNEGGSGGLAGEAGGGEHAAGAAGAVVGGGGQEHVVVGRLEEAEAGAAEGQPPAEVYGSGIRRDVRKEKAAGAHHQQTETT